MTAGRAAAEWWARQVGSPTFKMDHDDATGENRFRADMASVMMTMLAERHPVTEEQGQRFVEELAARVDVELALTGRAWLRVDYRPNLMLAEAAEAAGVHHSRFPIKSSTSVYPDHVTARLGYGAPSLLVWHVPGWEHPVCGAYRYEQQRDGDHMPLDELCTLPRYHVGDCGRWKPDPARCVTCGKTYSWHRGAEYRGHPWEPDSDGGAS